MLGTISSLSGGSRRNVSLLFKLSVCTAVAVDGNTIILYREIFFTLVNLTTWNNVSLATEATGCMCPAPWGTSHASAGHRRPRVCSPWLWHLEAPSPCAPNLCLHGRAQVMDCGFVIPYLGHPEITLSTSFAKSLPGFVAS